MVSRASSSLSPDAVPPTGMTSSLGESWNSPNSVAARWCEGLGAPRPTVLNVGLTSGMLPLLRFTVVLRFCIGNVMDLASRLCCQPMSTRTGFCLSMSACDDDARGVRGCIKLLPPLLRLREVAEELWARLFCDLWPFVSRVSSTGDLIGRVNPPICSCKTSCHPMSFFERSPRGRRRVEVGSGLRCLGDCGGEEGGGSSEPAVCAPFELCAGGVLDLMAGLGSGDDNDVS